MERLTKVTSCPNGTKIYDISNKLFGLNTSRADKTRMILEKLAEYEDLEEQGGIIKLPCKIGDTVYVPTRNFISELRITEVVCNRDGTYLRWVLLSGIYPNLNGFVGRKIGNEVFLTKSEAEAKLKELRGGEDESSN